MPELLVTPVPPESEQAAALRDEQARLEQTRARFNKGYLIEIGIWCLILFGYQLSQNQPGSIYVLLPGLGLRFPWSVPGWTRLLAADIRHGASCHCSLGLFCNCCRI